MMSIRARGERRMWALLVLALVAGCAAQPRPLSLRSTQAIVDARLYAKPWDLAAEVDDRPARVLVVLFDGTRNDRERIRDRERPTIIAHIRERLEQDGRNGSVFRYTAGPGTAGTTPVRWLDSATGASSGPRAVEACRRAVEDIRAIRNLEPEADVRILVAGFSRGAASARHFLNLIERDCDSRHPARDPGVRSYALLFDTVATGQRGDLLLGIPASTDHVLHFVSLDERRIFFRPDLDAETEDGRIRTILLPGVHSDVGDSYLEGVGGEVRFYVDALLYGMGLTRTDALSVPEDFSLQGSNDSRWLFDRFMGVPAALSPKDRGRRPIHTDATAMTAERLVEWHGRHAAMGQARYLSFYGREDVHRPAFQIRRSGADFELEAIGLNVLPGPVRWSRSDMFLHPSITACGSKLVLRYTVAGGSPHIFLLPDSITKRLRSQTEARLEMGVVSRSTGDQLWWMVDDKDAGKVGMSGGQLSSPAAARVRCPPA
jgi:hypothetical protein